MCGITGIISLNGQPVSLNELRNMTNSISHRGPDHEGSWIEKTLDLSYKVINYRHQFSRPSTNDKHKQKIYFKL